jgi:nucleoid-associated protein YgaU
VQLGDTLSSLAVLYYGSEKYTQFLIDSNPQLVDPNRIQVGTVIKIPPKPPDETLQRRTAPMQPSSERAAGQRRTYRVQPGDSFYAIAQNVLHDASRWQELFELNRELVGGDPTHLQVGQVLVLPNN